MGTDLTDQCLLGNKYIAGVQDRAAQVKAAQDRAAERFAHGSAHAPEDPPKLPHPPRAPQVPSTTPQMHKQVTSSSQVASQMGVQCTQKNPKAPKGPLPRCPKDLVAMPARMHAHTTGDVKFTLLCKNRFARADAVPVHARAGCARTVHAQAEPPQAPAAPMPSPRAF